MSYDTVNKDYYDMIANLIGACKNDSFMLMTEVSRHIVRAARERNLSLSTSIVKALEVCWKPFVNSYGVLEFSRVAQIEIRNDITNQLILIKMRLKDMYPDCHEDWWDTPLSEDGKTTPHTLWVRDEYNAVINAVAEEHMAWRLKGALHKED